MTILNRSRDTFILPRLLRRGGRTFAAVVLFALELLQAPSGVQASPYDIRQGSSIDVRPQTLRPPYRAAQILTSGEAEDPTAVTLRGPVESVDEAAMTIRLLGQEIAVGARTRVPTTLQSLSELREGRWVKVSARIQDNGTWLAERIRLDSDKERAKLEGTVSERWPAAGRPDSVSIGGFVVLVSGNTRIYDHRLTTSEKLFRDALDPRDPDHPAPLYFSERFWVSGKFGVAQRFEDNFTIGDSAEDYYRESEPILKTEFGVRGPYGLSGFLKLRSRAESVLQNAPLRKRNHDPAIELYEGYVLWRDIGTVPVALQIGRQDFEDTREWLFDDQLDAIRVFAYPLYPLVADIAYINSLDNSQSNKYRSNRDYLIRLRGRIVSGVYAGVYRFWRTDQSTRGREPIWTGVQSRAEFRVLKPWLELSWLRGWDKGRAFDASAYDFGTTAIVPLGGPSLSVTAGFAHGSGNANNPRSTGVDNQFRQTGYEDNTGQFNGVTSFQYYGEVLDPELANLDILTLGVGIRPRYNASIDVIYHKYEQSEYSTTVARDLESTGLTLFDYGGRGIDPSNGRPVQTLFPYKNVGSEVDIVIGLNHILGVLDIKYIIGVFSPNDALSPPFWSELPFKPDKRSAVMNQLGVEWRF